MYIHNLYESLYYVVLIPITGLFLFQCIKLTFVFANSLYGLTLLFIMTTCKIVRVWPYLEQEIPW